jgi:hypothetical protein
MAGEEYTVWVARLRFRRAAERFLMLRLAAASGRVVEADVYHDVEGELRDAEADLRRAEQAGAGLGGTAGAPTRGGFGDSGGPGGAGGEPAAYAGRAAVGTNDGARTGSLAPAGGGAAVEASRAGQPAASGGAALPGPRLGFYRWLVRHGRLSDTPPPSAGLRFARWLVETGRLSEWPDGDGPPDALPRAAAEPPPATA